VSGELTMRRDLATASGSVWSIRVCRMGRCAKTRWCGFALCPAPDASHSDRRRRAV